MKIELKHLNVLLVVLNFVALLAIAVPLYMSFAQMQAADLEANHLQDLLRQREMLDMRDLTRIRLEAEQWLAKGSAPPDKEFNELVDWFEQDLAELSLTISGRLHSQSYLAPVEADWQFFLGELKLLRVALAASEKSDAETHFQRMENFAQKLSKDLNSESTGLENPQLVTGETLERQIQLGRQFDQHLTDILVFFIFLAFGLAVYCQWGPTRFLDAVSNKTSLIQKFFLVAATPIAFELVFLALLALLFYHGNDGMIRIQRSRTLDRLHNQLYGQIVTLTQNGSASNPHLLEQMNAEIAKLRSIHKDRQQQLYSLTVIESGIGKIISLQNDLDQARRRSDNATSQLDERLIKQNFERAILYAFYGRANVGQQEVLRVKLHVTADQVETAKRLQLFMVLGIVLNIALAISLAAYFNRAASKRLAVISDNISRFASKQLLSPEVGGADEIARLDSFFHKMALAVEAATRRERAVIESATDIICSLDEKGNFAFVNPAVKDIWHYHPDDLKGKHVTEIIAGEEVGTTLHALDLLEQRHDFQSFENIVRRQDGSQADMHWSCQWSEAEGLIFCVLQDISESKQLERLKQEFVAIVSHDLRTPINSATAFLELLDVGIYGELTPKGERELEKDMVGLAGLTELIIDLLDIERMDAGKLELESELFDLGQIIGEAGKAVRSYAELRSIKVVIEPAVSEFNGDEDRIKQALVNLLAFAVKLSQKGKPVHVAVTDTFDSTEVRVHLDVANPAQPLSDQIFEPYRLNDISDVSESGGRRLGLALCKAIIKRHGGWIGVESAPDSQCLLWIRLPRANTAQEAQESSAAESKY